MLPAPCIPASVTARLPGHVPAGHAAVPFVGLSPGRPCHHHGPWMQGGAANRKSSPTSPILFRSTRPTMEKTPDTHFSLRRPAVTCHRTTVLPFIEHVYEFARTAPILAPICDGLRSFALIYACDSACRMTCGVPSLRVVSVAMFNLNRTGRPQSRP